MSKFNPLRTSAILITLSIFATGAGTVLAQGLPQNTIARPTIEQSAATNKIMLTRQKITSADVESKLEAMREKFASKEAILKFRLKSYGDQRKASAAARINANLNQINQNQTSQMQKNLDLMSTILDKLEARVNKPTPDIKDPVAAKAAIVLARSVIATTSAAVSEQAQKDYSISFTTENRIKLEAKTMRDKLHKDILSLRKIVIEAKQSVASAIRIAKSGPVVADINSEKEGTTSGRQ